VTLAFDAEAVTASVAITDTGASRVMRAWMRAAWIARGSAAGGWILATTVSIAAEAMTVSYPPGLAVMAMAASAGSRQPRSAFQALRASCVACRVAVRCQAARCPLAAVNWLYILIPLAYMYVRMDSRVRLTSWSCWVVRGRACWLRARIMAPSTGRSSAKPRDPGDGVLADRRAARLGEVGADPPGRQPPAGA